MPCILEITPQIVRVGLPDRYIDFPSDREKIPERLYGVCDKVAKSRETRGIFDALDETYCMPMDEPLYCIVRGCLDYAEAKGLIVRNLEWVGKAYVQVKKEEK